MDTRELWHGGRLPGLISGIKPPKAGRCELGPGLYLTTHYSTAQKYAKGNKATYKVALAAGRDIADVTVSRDDLFQFIDITYSRASAKTLKEYFNNPDNGPRSMQGTEFQLEVLLNLTINTERLLPVSKLPLLTKFFFDCGADYSVNTRFGGRDETVIVLFNPRLVKKVTQMPAKDWQPGWDPSDLRVKQLTEFFQNKS